MFRYLAPTLIALPLCVFSAERDEHKLQDHTRSHEQKSEITVKPEDGPAYHIKKSREVDVTETESGHKWTRHSERLNTKTKAERIVDATGETVLRSDGKDIHIEKDITRTNKKGESRQIQVSTDGSITKNDHGGENVETYSERETEKGISKEHTETQTFQNGKKKDGIRETGFIQRKENMNATGKELETDRAGKTTWKKTKNGYTKRKVVIGQNSDGQKWTRIIEKQVVIRDNGNRDVAEIETLTSSLKGTQKWIREGRYQINKKGKGWTHQSRVRHYNGGALIDTKNIVRQLKKLPKDVSLNKNEVPDQA